MEKSRSVKYESRKEVYTQEFDGRNVNVGNEVLQVVTDPFKFENMKRRKDRARRWMSAFLTMPIKARFAESKKKCFKVGQCGKGGGHRVGRKVPQIRNFNKAKYDEVGKIEK